MKNSHVHKYIRGEDSRIPMDFGSGPTTGMHVSVVAELREVLGFERKPVKVIEPYQMLGEIDEELKEYLGIETEQVAPMKNMFGVVQKEWKEWRTPWSQSVLVPKDFNTTVDSGGNVFIYPQGDRKAEPSGKMPASSYFFDTIIRQPVIDEERLNPEDNLEEFKILGLDELDHFAQEAKRVASSEKFVVANLGGMALGDIALVPAPFLKSPKGIRDISEWYMSTLIRQDHIQKIFERQVDISLVNLEKIHALCGDAFDAVYVCGTDFGTQNSTFCSGETFDELWAPHYKRLNSWIHENTNWLTFKHSCGAVESFIPRFMDCGFDILNPVQLSAEGMDADLLRDKYGGQIIFWGGGIDTQKTLPFGTPEEVRSEVLRNCDILGAKGGFVFNSVHNVQAKTPIKNCLAMFEALKEFNGR